MMKKLLLSVTVAFSVFALASCGGSKSNDAHAQKQKPAQTQLFTPADEFVALYKDAAKQLQENPEAIGDISSDLDEALQVLDEKYLYYETNDAENAKIENARLTYLEAYEEVLGVI